MTNKEMVLVAAQLECKHSNDSKVFCCRIRALGLTAYADSPEEAESKVKRMFATWVGLHRKSGTLEQNLNKSKLSWWYESDYDGALPYQIILAEGGVKVVAAKKQIINPSWTPMNQELVAAR